MDSGRFWRDRRDIYKATDHTEDKKYLLKEVARVGEDGRQDERTVFAELLATDEGKKYITGFQETVDYNEQKYLVFEK